MVHCWKYGRGGADGMTVARANTTVGVQQMAIPLQLNE